MLRHWYERFVKRSKYRREGKSDRERPRSRTLGESTRLRHQLADDDSTVEGQLLRSNFANRSNFNNREKAKNIFAQSGQIFVVGQSICPGRSRRITGETEPLDVSIASAQQRARHGTRKRVLGVEGSASNVPSRAQRAVQSNWVRQLKHHVSCEDSREKALNRSVSFDLPRQRN